MLHTLLTRSVNYVFTESNEMEKLAKAIGMDLSPSINFLVYFVTLANQQHAKSDVTMPPFRIRSDTFLTQTDLKAWL